MRFTLFDKLRSSSPYSGSAVYLFSNIITAVVPIVLLPVLTRYLNPSEYGEVAMFQTLLGALGAFVGLNVTGAAGRKFYDGYVSEHELKHFIAACLQILVASAGVALIIVFSLRQPLAEGFGLREQWVLWSVFVCAAGVIVSLRLGQWQVRAKSREYGALQISHGFINLLMSLLLVVVFQQGADGRIAGQIGAIGVFSLVSLLLLKRDELLAFFVWKPNHLKEALAFGVPLIPHVSGGFLLLSADRLIINAELGLAEAGVYQIAMQLAGATGLVFDAVNKAYVPWLFSRLQRNNRGVEKRIVFYTYLWFAIVLLIAGLLFLIGPWLIKLMAGYKYVRAGEIIGWLALGQAFGGMYLMVTNYIFYSKRTGLLSLVTMVSGLINLTLLVVFIRQFGLIGAATAFAGAMAIRFFLTWWVAQKRHPMPWFNFVMQI